MILGSTITVRTDDSDSSQQERLTTQWGSAQTQGAPQITATIEHSNKGIIVPIRSSRVNVQLELEQRRKGLLWYNLYNVSFAGHYVIRNNTNSEHLAVRFRLPDSGGSYADVTFRIGDRRIENATALDQDKVNFDLKPGNETTIDIGYRSRGMESWVYYFKNGVE